MRKLLVVLTFLMVAAFVLTACGPAATTAAPATAAPATAAPATMAPATMAPATEAPTQTIQSPYIGSGVLDGNGIPPNFFADVNVRQGFSYAFDWDTYINDVYKGEAIQSLELSLPGMVGYDPNAPHYTMDLDKSAAAFQASTLKSPDGQSLWDVGFRVQMLYNQGNTTRQTIAEILAANLSAVNPKFQVEILGLPWPAYLAAQRAGTIPIMTGGWIEDIHDPSNWYQPYTVGAYGGRQNMPDDLKAQFKTLLDEGVAATTDAGRADAYHQINQLYYDTNPGVPVVLPTTHGYEQLWVHGLIRNPIFPGIYFPTISKDATAKNPDTFTYATIGDADTLDPALAYDTASGEVLQNVYSTLIFYDGDKPGTFVPELASEMPTVSADGKSYTFTLRDGVKFQNGDTLTPEDVAYSFERGLLQGGGVSPQWLLSEPFFGVGNQDVTFMIDPTGALWDDVEGVQNTDPATLKSVCENLKSQFVVDDAANTVTMNLAVAWAPFLATIAQTWGSVMDAKWVGDNGGWDGSCDTWQNFYGMQAADDPLSKITNGTGPYSLDRWETGQQIVLKKFDGYFGTPANLDNVVIQIIPEWGTRFAELQAGDADVVDVPVGNRAQADALVSEMATYDPTTGSYGDPQPVCGFDNTKLAEAQFTVCEAGQTPRQGILRLYIGKYTLFQDVILYNFDIK
jgi:ABC-type transport system substrate-binding protein